MSCSDIEPMFTHAQTLSCKEIQPNIYEVKLAYNPSVKSEKDGIVHLVEPGQFFMLRREPSQVLLARPISVYWAEVVDQQWQVTFLILLKGQGTQ